MDERFFIRVPLCMALAVEKALHPKMQGVEGRKLGAQTKESDCPKQIESELSRQRN